MIQVQCSSLAPGARPRIHCDFVGTLIVLPKSAADIEKEIAEAESNVRAHPADALKNVCGASPPTQAASREWEAEPDGPDKTLFQALIAACRSGNAMIALQTYFKFWRQVTSQTCELSQTTWEATFERFDANTWISNSGPEGACHRTYVETLWREPNKGLLWSYRRVMTQPQAAKGDTICATMAGTHVDEYSWRNNRTRELGCRYFKL